MKCSAQIAARKHEAAHDELHRAHSLLESVEMTTGPTTISSMMENNTPPSCPSSPSCALTSSCAPSPTSVEVHDGSDDDLDDSDEEKTSAPATPWGHGLTALGLLEAASSMASRSMSNCSSPSNSERNGLVARRSGGWGPASPNEPLPLAFANPETLRRCRGAMHHQRSLSSPSQHSDWTAPKARRPNPVGVELLVMASSARGTWWDAGSGSDEKATSPSSPRPHSSSAWRCPSGHAAAPLPSWHTTRSPPPMPPPASPERGRGWDTLPRAPRTPPSKLSPASPHRAPLHRTRSPETELDMPDSPYSPSLPRSPPPSRASACSGTWHGASGTPAAQQARPPTPPPRRHKTASRQRDGRHDPLARTLMCARALMAPAAATTSSTPTRGGEERLEAVRALEMGMEKAALLRSPSLTSSNGSRAGSMERAAACVASSADAAAVDATTPPRNIGAGSVTAGLSPGAARGSPPSTGSGKSAVAGRSYAAGALRSPGKLLLAKLAAASSSSSTSRPTLRAVRDAPRRSPRRSTWRATEAGLCATTAASSLPGESPEQASASASPNPPLRV